MPTHSSRTVPQWMSLAFRAAVHKASGGRYWRGVKPLRVILNLTGRCNAACGTCHLWQQHAAELPPEVWLDVLSQIRRWLGPSEVILTGGEPLIYSGLTQVLGFLRPHGISAALLTNGHLLAEVAEDLRAYPISRVGISLYSSKPELHNRWRGDPRSWDKIWHGIRVFRSANPDTPVYLATVLTAENLGDIEKLTDLTMKEGLAGIQFQPVAPTFGEASQTVARPYWPADPAAVVKAVDRLVELKRAGAPIHASEHWLRGLTKYFLEPAPSARRCRTVNETLIIEQDGQVRLCYYLPPVGDAQHDRLHRSWRGSKARSIRRMAHACSVRCMLACHISLDEK